MEDSHRRAGSRDSQTCCRRTPTRGHRRQSAELLAASQIGLKGRVLSVAAGKDVAGMRERRVSMHDVALKTPTTPLICGAQEPQMSSREAQVPASRTGSIIIRVIE
jgi:hypothetical protein